MFHEHVKIEIRPLVKNNLSDFLNNYYVNVYWNYLHKNILWSEILFPKESLLGLVKDGLFKL